MLLARTGAVLPLLDGPVGFDPCFCFQWYRVMLFCGYVACRPLEVRRLCNLFGLVSAGCPGLGVVAFLTLHFRTPGGSKVCFDLCRWKGFRGGPSLDIAGCLQLLHASHVGDGDMALLRCTIWAKIIADVTWCRFFE